MTDPVTLATIGLGGSLLGGIVSSAGADSTGQAQQQMYNYKSQVDVINSTIDKQNAAYALNQGEIQDVQFGQRAAQQRGQIVANQGASNIAVNRGSNERVLQSQNTITTMDMAQIRNNAAKTAYDYSTKSVMDVNQSTLDTMAGSNAATAGDINAVGSLLSTGGSVATKWQAATQAGLNTPTPSPGFVSGL